MKLKRASSFKSRTPHTVGLHTQKLNVASWQCFNTSRVSNTSRGSEAFVLTEAGGLY